VFPDRPQIATTVDTGDKICLQSHPPTDSWTNANLTKDFVKVKTYSDLIVLKQDAYDKFGEPVRWVMYVEDFDKSSYPTMDKE
jgi:hypothetical protein